MSSVLPPLLALSVVAAITVWVYLRASRRFRQTDADRLAAWGHRKDRNPDIALISQYHFARVHKAGCDGSLDDRTWADLDMDAVFAFLDRAESAPGRQVLYDRLRSTAHSPEGLAAFDDLAERFRRNAVFRLRAQRMLAALNGDSVYWLWTLALEEIRPLPRWAIVYPLFAGAMLVCICLIPFAPKLLVVPVLGFVVGSALRASLGLRLVPLADAFRDMARTLVVADRLAAASELPDSWREVQAPLFALRRLRRLGASLGRDPGASFDLVGLLLEYLNLLFCLDANAVMWAVGELRRRQEQLHAVFAALGSLDAALSIASVRDGAKAWTWPAFAGVGEPAVFEGIRHPLIDNAVPNSVTLGPPAGLLVTGANMTGKSTFLRTIGVNAVLAQTIDTVFASRYQAPWLSVASCVAPTDDLQAGKSYYQAEVETLVAMLASTGASGTHLYLFDELFRGTNTLDRIGAASAVLAYLVRTPQSLVIAATHDLELLTLLPDYLVVHFGDRLTADGLQFDYKLRPGPTTTRNAIALLGVLGAPPSVVSEALERAERLRSRPTPSLLRPAGS